MKKETFYSISMGNGSGVLFIDTHSKERVKHEIDNLPDGWHINIWLVGENDIPIRKCNIDEF